MHSFRFFLSLLLPPLLLLNVAVGDVLTDTCTKIAKGDPKHVTVDFCIKTLGLSPKSRTADLSELGIISAKLLKTYVEDTHTFIHKTLEGKNWSKKEKSCLKTCAEVYSNGISWISEAIKYIKKEKYNDANIKLSAAMDSSSTCEDSLAEMKVKNPVLSKRNAEDFELAEISLSIVKMLSSKH